MGDESEKTRELCKREKNRESSLTLASTKAWRKSMKKKGLAQISYWAMCYTTVTVIQVWFSCIEDHKLDHKLIVLDVGLKHCGPCVKVYPTVIKLSKQMDSVVFARMNGDENDSCMQFLKDMDVIEVPTFLFIRDGEICGFWERRAYWGDSNQGVRVT